MSENTWNEEHPGEAPSGCSSRPPGPGSTLQPRCPVCVRYFDDLVERAEADAAFRSVVIADLEAALAREGVQPTTRRLEVLRSRLSP